VSAEKRRHNSNDNEHANAQAGVNSSQKRSKKLQAQQQKKTPLRFEMSVVNHEAKKSRANRFSDMLATNLRT